ncbi:ICMT-domain-containing protein [Cubamyces sp. BRFM 1775]|nr:ICMT-domain-containing protein [Cubamyces sp. BRFM 1775]
MPPISAFGPMLKVPLLLALAVCTWRSATPPRPPPPIEEQNRFPNRDSLSETMPMQIRLVTVIKWVLCGIPLAESTAIIAQYLPKSVVTARILSILLPTSGASLRLTPLSATACTLGIVGGLIRIWCYRTLGRFFTWELSVQREHKLVTSGPYAIVRHPSYTGTVLRSIGTVLLVLSEGSYAVEAGWLQSVWGKAVAFGVMGYMTFISYSLVRRIPKEDAMLEKEFGPQWREWRKRTPYSLVPFVY